MVLDLHVSIMQLPYLNFSVLWLLWYLTLIHFYGYYHLSLCIDMFILYSTLSIECKVSR